jgi:uncharacterized damage-inducible protein DinB
MGMIHHLQRLFLYDDWANREVLNALQGTPTPPARSQTLLAHIVAAEKLWLERLQVQKQTHAVWPQFTLAQCQTEIAELRGLWAKYLADLSEAGLPVELTYKNTKGESFTSLRQDILLHVVTHSAYHRGQIAADMRAAGFTPAYTDFIHAVRQGFLG